MMPAARVDPLLRALAIKAAALALGVAAALLLPPPGNVGAVAVVVLGTVGYFTYAIAYPRSQSFVPTVFRATTRRRAVALTFDDGPDPVFTPAILDVLAAHGARATFFVVGARAVAHPEIIRRIHAEGHTIGTHTQNHRIGFHFGGAATVRREIDAAIEVVEGLVPAHPTLFRPPHGVRSPCLARAFPASRALRCVTWSVRGLDARPTDADAIVARIEKGLTPGAIVALHDGTGLLGSTDRSATVTALERILERCGERGLSCVGLDELDRDGALVPGPGPSDAERFPFKARLPGLLYWPYRAWRTLAVGSCFAVFWSGAVLFAWVGLPILSLWPGTPAVKMRRAQRALRRCFDAFHLMMRVLWLYDRRTPVASARPRGTPPRGPVVLVANHPTLCDVTSIVSLFSDVVCLARAEFAENVLMGRLLRICGFIPTGVHMIDESVERLGMGFDVLVFPEGTRSPLDGGLQPFHRGAFEIARRARVPIVLLKLTCRPSALSKALPIWRHPDRMAILTVEPVETIEPDDNRNSKTLCRDVERRYHELLGLAPEPGPTTSAEPSQ
jgi:1-acyl-sn-glycerol-3-phosphate acyltransferase